MKLKWNQYKQIPETDLRRGHRFQISTETLKTWKCSSNSWTPLRPLIWFHTHRILGPTTHVDIRFWLWTTHYFKPMGAWGDSSTHNQNYIFFLLPLVLLINLDTFGVTCCINGCLLSSIIKLYTALHVVLKAPNKHI